MSTEKCVLMVDDDRNDVFLLERAFREADISNPLHAVFDGQQAIDYLSGAGQYSNRSQFPLPILVILDLKMPRKTGLDVLQWIGMEMGLQCIPIMVLSSSAHPGDVEKAYQFGANAFVVKPSGLSERKDLATVIKLFWINFNVPPLVCTEGLEAARRMT